MIDLDTLVARKQPSRNPQRTSSGSNVAVWPLPMIDGRAPIVLDSSTRAGIDLACERELVPGDQTKSTPNTLPALAVSDGVIAYAGNHAGHHALIVDHENGWATHYSNLEHVFAMPTSRRTGRCERVKAADVLGYVGLSGRSHMRCLHFELWRLGPDHHYGHVDPREHMKSWIVLPWTDEPFTPNAPAKRAARS